MAEDGPGTREEVLRLWEETHFRLNEGQRAKFLARPETAALTRIPTDHVVVAFAESPKLSEALDFARQRRDWSRGMARGPAPRQVSRPRHPTNLESPKPEQTESEDGRHSGAIVGSFGQPVYVDGVCPVCLQNDEDCFCG